jgi:hypothetical protein
VILTVVLPIVGLPDVGSMTTVAVRAGGPILPGGGLSAPAPAMTCDALNREIAVTTARILATQLIEILLA